jgi:exosortase/archaeosortase family protein
LWWNGQSILIDAPCAGIAMLWLGWYLSALFSYLHTATVIRSVFNLAIASVVVVIANVLRNILLFYKEAGIVQLPHWAHEAIGLLVFALVIPLIYQATAQHGFAQDRTRQAHPERNHRFAIRPKAVKGRIQQNSFVCFIVVMLVCGLYPLGFAKPEAFAQAAPPMEQNWAFDRWATATKTVFPLPLTALEQRFARDFPGEIGRFSNGNTVWVVRHIRRATRLLHPATDCYRGLGYQVSKTHVVQQADHTRWQCFIAERGQKLRVCERIFDKQNRQWTDVSAWYWENLRPKSLQEWWAITEVHPAGNDDVLAMGGL